MIKLYSRISDHETVLELWGASTKHPDSVFYFSDFQKCLFINEQAQVFQWMLECASKLNFPFYAYDLAKRAIMFHEYFMEYVDSE